MRSATDFLAGGTVGPFLLVAEWDGVEDGEQIPVQRDGQALARLALAGASLSRSGGLMPVGSFGSGAQCVGCGAYSLSSSKL